MGADRYVRGRSRLRSFSRHRRDSSTDSSDSSSSSDSLSRRSRRDRSSGRHKRSSCSRSLSPRKTSRTSRSRRHHRYQRGSFCRQDTGQHGDTIGVAQGLKARGSGGFEDRKTQRIAPNASAFKSIMLSTARSRDRMDQRERAQAQKKLESLDRRAQSSTD